MPETPHLLAFVGAALVLLLTPGPAVLFVVTRSVELGRGAGVLSALGLTAGGLVHVVAAVAGLSAVLSRSAELFGAIKLIGGAYLVFLGLKTLTGAGAGRAGARTEPVRPGRLFLDAFLVNVLNPKTAIFFVAFLPQFVTPGGDPLRAQLAFLGVVFIALALVTDSGYALLAAGARGLIGRRPGLWRGRRYVSGTVYIGLGLTAALTGRHAP